jgi:hypothetical protein
VETIHVLVRIDGEQDLLIVDVFGQGKLHQDAVNFWILVVLVDESQQRLLIQVGGLIILDGVKTEFMGGFLLGTDVTLRSGIFTYQDGYQTWDNVVFGL